MVFRTGNFLLKGEEKSNIQIAFLGNVINIKANYSNTVMNLAILMRNRSSLRLKYVYYHAKRAGELIEKGINC